jgi:hypothetical protein
MWFPMFLQREAVKMSESMNMSWLVDSFTSSPNDTLRLYDDREAEGRERRNVLMQVMRS